MDHPAIKAAKGILYVLSRIAIVIVVAALIIIAYYAAQNTMNIRMVVKDAFSTRAAAVLSEDEDGRTADLMSRFFTTYCMSADPVLHSTAYNEFDITNYYQRTDVDNMIVWPWEDRTTITVHDFVTDIAGTIQEDPTEESGGSVTVAEVPKWQNGAYVVRMVKHNDTWMVDGISFSGTEMIDSKTGG